MPKVFRSGRRPLAPEPLEPSLSGERIGIDSLAGYTAGQGPPVLLVHGVHLAASAAEWRPVFEALRARWSVWAIDLPGFGLSDRSPRAYTPRLMTDALHATTAHIRRQHGPGPVDALALGLGCEFLARAALEQPTHFRRLVFVSPTGLDGRTQRRAPEGLTHEVPGLHALLHGAGWGGWLYRRLTQPAALRRALQRTWGTRQLDPVLWQYAQHTAQRPEAWHAPLQWLAGRLASADIHPVYEQLTQPVWLARGVQGRLADCRMLPLLPALARWRQTVFLSGALPQVERPAAFVQRLQAFLEAPVDGAPATGPQPVPAAALHAASIWR